MIIAFHTNQLSERGTEVAIFDYAYYHQKRGFISIILFKDIFCQKVYDKFKKEFKCIQYNNFSDIDQIIIDNKINYFYSIEPGDCVDRLVTKCPNLIHAVFRVLPHGEKYAAISDAVAKNKVAVVPHMINLPSHDRNLRKKLNIPENAIVLGRYGGYDQFDISYVHQAISEENNIYFLFANTRPFCQNKNIIYLDTIIDLEEKVEFINTCDAMIHARVQGESFGLSIGEFSSKNKPIITCTIAEDYAHLYFLAKKAIYYKNYEEIKNIFNNISNIIKFRSNWICYEEFTPDNVMNKFYQVFLNPNYINMNQARTLKNQYSLKDSIENITIVTGFLNINRGNWKNHSRSIDNYVNSFKKYLNYGYKIILFLDDTIDLNISNQNLTLIKINREWLSINCPMWSYLKITSDIMFSENYRNLVKNRDNPENNYPEYNIIMHCKMDFLKYSIENFKLKFVVWSDFGYHNSILKNEIVSSILDLNKFNLDKLNFCLRNKVPEYNPNLEAEKMLVAAPEIFTGSFFAGNSQNILKLYDLYRICLEELHSINITDDDQHIYLCCYLKNPSLFELYLDDKKWPTGLKYFELEVDRIDLIKSLNFNVAVEIGVCEGDFSPYLLREKLYCIDPYISYTEYEDSCNNIIGDQMYERVKNKLLDNMILIRDFSINVDINQDIDLVYIDGNHKYKYVLQDLNKWYDKLKSGSIIIADDAVDIDDEKRDTNGDVTIEWSSDCVGKYGVIKAFRDFGKAFSKIGTQIILIKK